MIIEEHARLEVKLPDGRSFTVYENDIVADSLSVSKQCVNGSAFSFGCVSPAQLSVRFRIADSTVSRYDMYGAEITLYRWFGTSPSAYGGKSGIFNVTSASRKYDIFTVAASDNICWLDSAAFGSDSESGMMGNAVYKRLGEGGSRWNAIDAMGIIVSELAGGLAFKAGISDVRTIPNAYAEFTGYGVKDTGTHTERLILVQDDEQSDNLRDYVSWLAAYMGGFVCADFDGTIVFRLFQTPYYDSPAVLQYSEFQAESLEIAGFEIFLYGNQIVTEDNAFAWVRFPKSEKNGVISVEIVEKQNPFIEFVYSYNGSMNGLTCIPDALCYYQKEIPIRPFSGTYHGTQYLEPGQYIQINLKDEAPCRTVITSVLWKFRGGQQIRCTGEDARTLSETRKRSQAIRTGERLKTQLLRLEDRVTSGNNQFSSDISAVGNRVSALEGQNLNSRISTLENQNLAGRLDDLSSRVTRLENGG